MTTLYRRTRDGRNAVAGGEPRTGRPEIRRSGRSGRSVGHDRARAVRGVVGRSGAGKTTLLRCLSRSVVAPVVPDRARGLGHLQPEDLAGKTFAFNDPNSTSGYLVPSAFFMTEMNTDPAKLFWKVTFSGSHEASILAVANKKVEVASTNLPDLQQLMRENKVPRGALRVIWVSKLIPNDPIVVRKDLPASLRSAVQESLTTMKARHPEAFKEIGAWVGGFVPADDGKYQVVRELDEVQKKLAAKK